MPLIQSSSKQAVGENIKREMDSGRPHKQSIAIALAVKRKNKKAKGGMIDAPEALSEAKGYEDHVESMQKAPGSNESAPVPSEDMSRGDYPLMMSRSMGEDNEDMHPQMDIGMEAAAAHPLEKALSHEESIEEEWPAEPKESVSPARENLPASMMAKGGLMQPRHIVHMIMMKKAKGGMAGYADGGMINQGDNMPVNDDIDNFSAETSSEGPLDEGELERDRENKIMKRKSMLGSIMARMHSDNKGY